MATRWAAFISCTYYLLAFTLYGALTPNLAAQATSSQTEQLESLVEDAAPRAAKLQIINASDRSVSVYWVDKSQEAAEAVLNLKPGQNKTISTYVGHTHRLRDESGELMTEVVCQVPIQACRFQAPGQWDLAQDSAEFPQNELMDVSPKMNVPEFYSRILFANGLPIVGSSRVDDHALLEAAYLSNQLLSQRPDVLQAMIRSGSRMCIMSEDEFTTDLPEFAWLGKRSPLPGIDGRDYWDARARGLGGSETDPYCSCGEENLLNYSGDPYSTENILIHEFAHNIHLRGMNNVDPTFDQRLRKTYANAMDQGLWKGKYASVNHHEYFAEGVQSWFNNNRENDHDHNHVNTREELWDYDPGLAEMCKEVFGETQFRYLKTGERLKDHLADYQPEASPAFQWPKRLELAKRRILQQAQNRDKEANQ